MMMRELLRRVERLGSSAEASAEERALKELTELHTRKWREHNELDQKLKYPSGAGEHLWTYKENRNLPRFQDVFDNFTRDAAAAKAMYNSIRQDIKNHETEKLEAISMMEKLAPEVARLQAEVKEREGIVRLYTRAAALAPLTKKYQDKNAEGLKSAARSVYAELGRERENAGVTKHGTTEQTKAYDEKNTELDAIILLLTKHNVATIFASNTINFAPRSTH